jgi:gamma-glutamylcyclotransferase (GGCT)/AIG2-like uncharacterized protein YtfP
MKSESSTLDVFVYGTLKPGEANFSAYCGGKVITQTPAYTWGELYALSVGYPAMTEGKNKVQGMLLSFRDRQILQDLDQLEDYQAYRDKDLNEYYRASVEVYSLGDRGAYPQSNLLVRHAWAYFMTLAKVKQYQGIKLPSGIWTGKGTLIEL